MRSVALLLLVACEKSHPVEATPGSATTIVATAEPPRPSVDAAVVTLPSDAAVVAPPPPPIDAAKVPPSPSRDDLLAMADALSTTSAPSDRGGVADRRPGADLQAQLDRARGGTTSTPGSPTTPAPPGRITVSTKLALDETSLTVDVVLAKVLSAYLPGIKRCYAAYLKTDGSARGKLKLSLTVDKLGRATAGRASGFAKEIDDCVAGMMTFWRFAIPKDVDGEVTDASFQIDLQLVPD